VLGLAHCTVLFAPAEDAFVIARQDCDMP
jgi:hypothetical protein